MNYCQVERDTEKYLAAQCLLDDAHEAAEEEAEAEVLNFKGNYYFADSHNMLEALSEIKTLRHEMKDGLTYQEQLTMLIGSGQYEAFGKLCEKISREYWTEWLVDLVD